MASCVCLLTTTSCLDSIEKPSRAPALLEQISMFQESSGFLQMKVIYQQGFYGWQM